MTTKLYARLGAALYAGWGIFHIYVAWQIYALANTQDDIAQGRMLQLAAYMLSIALFAIAIAVWRNWRNDPLGYWLNLAVVSWADVIWILVVVLPGYVPFARGLVPPAIWLLAALFSTLAYQRREHPSHGSDATSAGSGR